MKRVAVVGAGVSGLGAAWALRRALPNNVSVTLYEAESRLGGHAHTVDVTLPDPNGQSVTHGVDTGFLVFNERTYPRLIALFESLQVPTALSDMSFSVQVPPAADTNAGHSSKNWMAGLEWSGSNLDTVFTQRRRLLSPPFWRMLVDIMRFNKLATQLALSNDKLQMQVSVNQFLRKHDFSSSFRDAYLLPMVACIWSCPVEQMLQFPVSTLIRFCHNHGLLQVANRPQWFTVRGGSREYVKRLAAAYQHAGGMLRVATPVLGVKRLTSSEQRGLSAGVAVHTAQGVECYDQVVLACHSDQALALLGEQASEQEQQVLGAIRYHANRAVLHTDTSLMPRDPKAWAAWNYERAALNAQQPDAVCLHYWLNRLQPLPWRTPLMVSLNPLREPRAATVLQTFDYAHPVFDQAAVQAQQLLEHLQGKDRVWFCGAWTGYGFHEDGLKSGQSVAQAMATQVVQQEQAA
jgi:uncharacterized protein